MTRRRRIAPGVGALLVLLATPNGAAAGSFGLAAANPAGCPVPAIEPLEPSMKGKLQNRKRGLLRALRVFVGGLARGSIGSRRREAGVGEEKPLATAPGSGATAPPAAANRGFTPPEDQGGRGVDDRDHVADISAVLNSMSVGDRLAVATLESTALQLTASLAALPNDGRFVAPGGAIAVAELRELWVLVDFRIMPSGTQYRNGTHSMPGVGVAIWNAGDPVFETSIESLHGFMAHPDNALWYLLHELVHVTGLGRQRDAALYADGVLTDEEHLSRERWVNDISRAIATQMGRPYGEFLVRHAAFGPGGVTFSLGGAAAVQESNPRYESKAPAARA
ncbi:MAG TPA: hypothetical protein VGD13_06160 [Xanthobacteraceae bacterium]